MSNAVEEQWQRAQLEAARADNKTLRDHIEALEKSRDGWRNAATLLGTAVNRMREALEKIIDGHEMEGRLSAELADCARAALVDESHRRTNSNE